jgi:hypothetical protein
VLTWHAEQTWGHPLLPQAVGNSTAVNAVSPSQLVHGLARKILLNDLSRLGSSEAALHSTWRPSPGKQGRYHGVWFVQIRQFGALAATLCNVNRLIL